MVHRRQKKIWAGERKARSHLMLSFKESFDRTRFQTKRDIENKLAFKNLLLPFNEL